VLLDPALSCSPSAQIFQGGVTLVFAAADAPPPPYLPLSVPPVEVERVAATGRRLDLEAVIARLTAREVNELLVECGPRLAGAFLEAGLVDELILYVAPILLGADAAPLTALSGLRAKSPLPGFEFASEQRMGADLRLILIPTSADSAAATPTGS
jgi:diaminohydroxyphosphoribosylaminopyrimidine deaminase/5-amino-6-(5-phosphoribosylamino)uracil reductase